MGNRTRRVGDVLPFSPSDSIDVQTWAASFPARIDISHAAHRRAIEAFARQLQKRLRRAAPRRYGYLRDSITVRASIAPGGDPPGTRGGQHWSYAVQVLSDDPAMLVQEAGGTLRPIRARFLAIPITEEAKRANARGIGGPRDVGGKWVTVASKDRSRLYLARPGGGRVWYRLVSSVRMPRQPFIGPTARRMRRRIGDLVNVARAPLLGRMLGVSPGQVPRGRSLVPGGR